MPYQGESVTGHLAYVSAATSNLVADVLASYEPLEDDPGFVDLVRSMCTPITDLDLPIRPGSIATCLSVDGSRQQDVVDNSGRRAKSVGFVRVGGAVTDLAEYRALARERFIDPAREWAARRNAILDYPLPGALVGLRGHARGESWRPATNRMLSDVIVSDALFDDPADIGISLADALLVLFGEPGNPAASVPVQQCPTCGDSGRTIGRVTKDGGTCTNCQSDLYLVDALGLDAAISSETSRENALTVTMNAVERLAFVAFMEMVRLRSFEALATTIFVIDGPMAAFGPVAVLTRPLRRYLDAVAEELLAETGRPLLVVGIEKSGDFVNHGESIEPLIEPGHVMTLTNDYIADHVTGRGHGRNPYGAQHFYGRRFYYRRHDGRLLVVTVPAVPGVAPWSKDDPASWDLTSYPTLRPILELLESMRCVKYDGAVLPLVFAHQASALPMGTGRNVLTRLAQDGLGLEHNTRVAAETRRSMF